MAKDKFTVHDFFRRFPDDGTCLDHLMKLRFDNPLDCPKCGNWLFLEKAWHTWDFAPATPKGKGDS